MRKYCPKGHVTVKPYTNHGTGVYCSTCHKTYYKYHYKGFKSERERREAEEREEVKLW